MDRRLVETASPDIARVTSGWRIVNAQIREQLNRLPASAFGLQLGDALRAPASTASDMIGSLPIWAIASHLAGARIYWLCGILGQPGADSTPFDGSGESWEDHLDVPRSKDEVLRAIDSTWEVVEHWLAGWSPARESEIFSRQRAGGTTQRQTHHLVLVRMITHDAYHAGELGLILGVHGIEPLDLWQRLELPFP